LTTLLPKKQVIRHKSCFGGAGVNELVSLWLQHLHGRWVGSLEVFGSQSQFSMPKFGNSEVFGSCYALESSYTSRKMVFSPGW
jgi:hypothetical protein